LSGYIIPNNEPYHRIETTNHCCSSDDIQLDPLVIYWINFNWAKIALANIPIYRWRVQLRTGGFKWAMMTRRWAKTIKKIYRLDESITQSSGLYKLSRDSFL
jgi:hypothetical protein